MKPCEITSDHSPGGGKADDNVHLERLQ